LLQEKPVLAVAAGLVSLAAAGGLYTFYNGKNGRELSQRNESLLSIALLALITAGIMLLGAGLLS
jgi:hypothetical protein